MAQRLTFPADHPALPGHFPGRPMVPGVVLLDRIMVAAEAYLSERDGGRWRIGQAPTVKFLRPLPPGVAVDLHFDGSPGKLRFRAELTEAPGAVVVSGTLAGTRE